MTTGKEGGRIYTVVLHHRHEILGHASARAVAASLRVVLNLLPLLRAVVMHGQVRVFTISNTGQIGCLGRGGFGKDGFTVEQQCIEEAALAGFDLAHDAYAQVLLILFDALQLGQIVLFYLCNLMSMVWKFLNKIKYSFAEINGEVAIHEINLVVLFFAKKI